jgi:cytochrome c oxidase subunit 3
MALPSLAPPAPVRRPRVLVVGTTFATAATVVAFVGMLGFYLLERAAVVSSGADWLPDGATIPLTQPNVMFLGLIMSSVTMQWVLQAVRNDDRPNTYLAIGTTLLIGLAFVNMGFYLYSLMGLDIDATDSAAPLLIYTITGAHLAMAIIAMFFLGLMGFRALAGQYTSRQHDGLAAAAVFWQAMVAVYGVIWITIYVTK